MLLTLCAGCLAVTGAGPAHAQSAPHAQATAPPQPAPEAPPVALPELKVRGLLEQGYVVPDAGAGTKTQMRVLDLPFSVQTVSRPLLDDQAVVQLKDALKNVAGVIPGAYWDGWDYYRIRGFDATGFTFLDGLNVDPYWWFAEETFGLERIEVLKGPAAALYGQGSLGGIVNLVSKRPRPERFVAAHFTAGSYEFLEGGVDLGGALDERQRFLGRLNALYRQRGTFVDFVPPSERVFVAPAFTLRLSPDTSITLLTQYLEDKHHPPTALPAEGTILLNPNGELPITRNTGEKNHPNTNALWRVLAGYALEHRLNEIFTIRQNLRGSVNHVADRFIYNGYSADSGFTSGFQSDLRTLERFAYRSVDDYWTLAADTTLEAKFTTGPVKHTAMAGVDYAYLDAKNRRWTNENSANDVAPIDLYAPVYGAAFPDLSLTRKAFTRSDSVGFYLQEVATLFDRVTLLGGGRVDVVSSTRRDELAGTTTKTHDSAFSPRVGASWELVRGASVYASYGKSFRPQTDFQNADGSTVAPETGVNYEVGFKTLLFDGRLTSTLALFELTRQNVATSDPQNPGFYRVTGEQRSRGVELDVATRPLPGWDFIVAYAYRRRADLARPGRGDRVGPRAGWHRHVGLARRRGHRHLSSAPPPPRRRAARLRRFHRLDRSVEWRGARSAPRARDARGRGLPPLAVPVAQWRGPRLARAARGARGRRRAAPAPRHRHADVVAPAPRATPHRRAPRRFAHALTPARALL